MTPSTEQLASIQALRALAAGLVLVGHLYGYLLPLYPDPAFPQFAIGAAGVDLFFVISGFVMVYSSERLFGTSGATVAFATRRIIRIVPLYWLITTALLAHILLTGSEAFDLSFKSIAATYFFIPYPNLSGKADPLLAVGWTLNFEMYFYAIFALALFARNKLAVVLITSTIIVAVVLWSAESLPFEFYGRQIVIEFVLGMLIALAYRGGGASIRFSPRG